MDEKPAIWKVLVDAKAAFVHECVVPSAQQHQVVERGFAAGRPVLNMMGIEEATVSAARERAAVVVPSAYGPGNRLGNNA